MKITSSIKWLKLISSVNTKAIQAIKNNHMYAVSTGLLQLCCPQPMSPIKTEDNIVCIIFAQRSLAEENNTALPHSHSEISDKKTEDYTILHSSTNVRICAAKPSKLVRSHKNGSGGNKNSHKIMVDIKTCQTP